MRGRDLCRRACAGWKARLLYQLDPRPRPWDCLPLGWSSSASHVAGEDAFKVWGGRIRSCIRRALGSHCGSNAVSESPRVLKMKAREPLRGAAQGSFDDGATSRSCCDVSRVPSWGRRWCGTRTVLCLFFLREPAGRERDHQYPHGDRLALATPGIRVLRLAVGQDRPKADHLTGCLLAWRPTSFVRSTDSIARIPHCSRRKPQRP